ncbi:MAG: UDP-N-acetylmuramate:L-alanyl-gamma-D-glutamyl-meso-diaminopimelate ligase, partial [Deltaproteobacteria bacterium]|nr:UDP-N-acetylmuramate:L-alanyl-gamma-D-glutamyl-meso-diaminopimelate ligase [Deltaproteobacteria bacterium]
MHTQQNPDSLSRPLAHLSSSLNRIPCPLHHIHLMGICGTGMASLAGMLKELGYRVAGSDQNVYPPMSDFLRGLSIPVREGYGAGNLSSRPDLVIVGNVITRENPEAVELSRLAIPYLSLPQALGHFAFGDRKSVVVCGTHGKTTTSALAAWVLERGGMDPGFMIGGIPLDFNANFKLGKGPYFVIEGDEYDTAFFDKGPKFLHYRPWFTILTGIEFDHADIYRDIAHVRESFRRLIALIPPGGRLIANGDDPIVRAEAQRAACPVTFYALENPASWKAWGILQEQGMTRLEVSGETGERVIIETPLYGRHNVSNLLSVVALAHYLGIDPSNLAEALRSFRGVRRRQEIRGEKRGVLVLDDFAHHPTAVRETLRAVWERYPGRRLVAVFEPRSNSSRRNVFQEA